jgi:DNA-directed RNA polymerase subunit M
MRVDLVDNRRGTRKETKTSKKETPQAEPPEERSKATHMTNPKKPARPKLRHGKFCPKCGSTEVFWAQGLPQLWSLWDCHNCGYRGPVILEDGNLAEKLVNKWKKQKSQEKP